VKVNVFSLDKQFQAELKSVVDTFSCEMEIFDKVPEMQRVVKAVRDEEILFFEKGNFSKRIEATLIGLGEKLKNKIFVCGKVPPQYGPNIIYLTKKMAPLFLSMQIDRRQTEDKAQKTIRSQSEELNDLRARLSTLERNIDFLRNKTFFLDKQRMRLGVVLERMNTIARLSHELNCLDLEEIVNVCIYKIPLLVDAKNASFYMYDYEKEELRLVKHNHPHELAKTISLSENKDSLMAQALAGNGVLLIRDIGSFEKEKKVHLKRNYKDQYRTSSCIISPIRAGNRIIGVLNLSDKTDGGFFDEMHDLAPIEQLSDLIGASIRNYQLYREVREKARIDGMTNFLNHNSFFEELEKEISRARRYKNIFSLIMMDVDNFKHINDIYGHLAGDHVLKRVASIIKENIRGIDIPARYGGDEFTVIFPHTDLENVRNIADRIRKLTAEKEMIYGKKKISVTVSIGLMQYKPDLSLTELIKQVDEALYKAKFKGRNRIVVVG